MTKKKSPKNKAADYASLAALGIAKIEVIYDGCGDSGCIEEATAYDEAGHVIETMPDTLVTITVRDTVWNADTNRCESRFIEQQVPPWEAIKHWYYDILEDHFPGWEIDDGSSGTITIDVKKRRGKLEHEGRYTETYSDTRRFS